MPGTPLLICETVEIPQGVVLKLRGEIRLDAKEAEEQFNRLAARHAPLTILDCSELSFVSSIGMELLIGLHKAIAGHGTCLRLAALQPLVRDSFRRARLGDFLHLYPTVEEAMA
jgi:anti-anti-sigma factor